MNIDHKQAGDNVSLSLVLTGLATAGVVITIVNLKDFTLQDVNPLFERLTGFMRHEVVGSKFLGAPLFSRHVHGDFPRESFLRSADPDQAMIPTASTEDYTIADFREQISVLTSGGSWQVVSRHMIRNGSILESLTTLFLLRDNQNQPNAVMSISTPEHRREIPLCYHSDPITVHHQSSCQPPLPFNVRPVQSAVAQLS